MREMKIQFIRGTINNETCFIHVYSNGIEIIIPPTQSNSEEKLFVYEFDNICQLKINHRIEEKKKFLSKIKTFYLQISIDGSINKQSQDIPDIIVSEDDYNTITNSINDYIYKIEEHNKKIKEREEREKRRREEIIRAQEFKNEFIHYYDSLFIFYHAKLDSETMQKKIEDRLNGKSIFLYLVIDMYKKIGNTHSLNQVVSSICSIDYFKTLLYKTVNFRPSTDEGVNIPDGSMTSIYESVMNIINNDIDLYINEKISTNYHEETIVEWILREISKITENFYIIPLYCFMVMFLSAVSFIKCLVMCRSYQKFENNAELHKMFSNLTNVSDVDSKYIAEKLYPLYSNYYRNTFNEEYTSQEFYEFIVLYRSYVSNRVDAFEQCFIEDIEVFRNSIIKRPEEYLQNEYDVLLDEVNKFLKNIDNSKYFSLISKTYSITSEDAKAIYIIFYNNILKYFGQKLPAELFYILIDEDYWANINMLYRKHENEVLENEKERLLKGNLEIERQLQIDKYAFENITTGYEFEEYLRSLFEGMGYIVNLTQKSNDQGGDLVIEKDRERTVVQAKFYSSPVGNKAVQEVVAAKSFYEANKGMIVTNSTYTNSAVALAEVNDITLIDGDELNRIRNAILETI